MTLVPPQPLFQTTTDLAFLPNLHNQRLACTTRVKDPLNKRWIVLCHGVFSYRKNRLFETIMAHCPLNSLSFDFLKAANSEGNPQEWSLGDYDREAEVDVRGIVLKMREAGLNVVALFGHSRGANVILMYGYKFDDVPFLVSLAARYSSSTGLDKYFAPGDMQRLEKGEVEEVPCMKKAPDQVVRKITRSDLVMRKSIDMAQVASIKQTSKIWFVHGTEDDVIPYSDAELFHETTRIASEVLLIPQASHPMRSPLGKKGLEPLIEILKDTVFPELVKFTA
eukprot:Protomagalhaensia_wolfi_Nauph_80__1032@NODE_159_length_3373_cov_32_161368_g120_i0_p2_GENE_NODE_159_length_3373_cov_32_161368_g120_i0NODE_159_length_3373_cov_32_161368_g120_i0_p2_ORF_typecomplete_len280_score59_53Hydrolase_4/PF12146_8/2e12BAAT_C/PF08840_11/1_2e08Peptidase_S9/PF00326_21/2_7e07Abhydrolase_1/PF00561_20/6_7e06DUF1749/PF08538_10/0_00063DUF1749/PF08538_10/48Abhydrolase_2/PF02230_16/0_00056UPF0227/PF05728_12/0_00016DLH/PF01738_18/0_00076Abhydrolase_5/PF12695_7/0_23Abhydrolase_5/PF12695_